jgi:hypothetical protein
VVPGPWYRGAVWLSLSAVCVSVSSSISYFLILVSYRYLA